MSIIFEINRDYPYQVALVFDEAAMDVLDWLEVRLGHVCQPAGEHGAVLLSYLGRRRGIQTKVRRCVASARYRRRLIDRRWPSDRPQSIVFRDGADRAMLRSAERHSYSCLLSLIPALHGCRATHSQSH
jgi:hypothetical protein